MTSDDTLGRHVRQEGDTSTSWSKTHFIHLETEKVPVLAPELNSKLLQQPQRHLAEPLCN